MPNEPTQPSRSSVTPIPVRKPHVDAEWAGVDVSFGEAVATVFRKYAQFDGLARRSEYWWWYLFVTTVGFTAAIVDSIATAGVLTTLWFFITLLPSLAVTVRRLRDAGYFWAVIFVGIIPIALLVLLCQRTDEGWQRRMDSGLRDFPPIG